MSGPAGYDVADDPDCYAGTGVLRNKANLRDQKALDQFEGVMTELRLSDPLPRGDLGAAHYRAIHRYMFQDVYAWAGKDRTIRTHKGASTFCYPERIEPEMTGLFDQLAADDHLRGLDRQTFAAKAAAFLSYLNAIHPFREGNGRVMKAYFALLAEQAEHPIALRRIKTRPYLAATIQAFGGDDAALAEQIESWIMPKRR